MPIVVTCDQCGQQSSAADSAAGKKARCKCGHVVTVPVTSRPVPRPAPPPDPLGELLATSLPAAPRLPNKSGNWFAKHGVPTPAGIAVIGGGLFAFLLATGVMIWAANWDTTDQQKPPTAAPSIAAGPQLPAPLKGTGWHSLQGRYHGAGAEESAVRRGVARLPFALADTVEYHNYLGRGIKMYRFQYIGTLPADAYAQTQRALSAEGFEVQSGGTLRAQDVSSTPQFPLPPMEAAPPPARVGRTSPPQLAVQSILILQLSDWKGAGDPAAALRGALEQIPQTVPESVIYDPQIGKAKCYLQDTPADYAGLFATRVKQAGFGQVGVGLTPQPITIAVAGGRVDPPLTIAPPPAVAVAAAEKNPQPEKSNATYDRWELQPDPAVPGERSSVVIPVEPNFGGAELFFSAPRIERAAVVSVNHAIGLYDLRSARIFEQAKLTDGKVLALSPDGEHVAVLHQANGSFLQVYRLQSGKAVSVFRLEAQGAYSIDSAKFAADERLLVVQSLGLNGQLQSWNLRAAKQEWTAKIDDFHNFYLSPTGRYVLIRREFPLFLLAYETATGRRVGAPALEKIDAFLDDVAFSPDGETVALKYRTPSAAWLSGIQMRDGQEAFRFPAWKNDYGRNQLVFADSRFLLQSAGPPHTALIDLKYQQIVWEYQWPSPGKGNQSQVSGGKDPLGRLWYAKHKLDTNPAFYGHAVPRAAERQAIDAAFAKFPPLLQAGDEVALEIVPSVPIPRTDFEPRVRGGFAKQLAARGIKVAPGAAKKLRVNIRVTYGPEIDVDVIIVRLGILPTKHPVRTTNTEVVLDMALVDTTGAEPWKWSIGLGVRPTIWHVEEEGRVKPEDAARMLPWVNAIKFANDVPLPRTFYPRLDKPVGTTALPLE